MTKNKEMQKDANITQIFQHHFKEHGFTMLEAMLTVAVILVLSVGGFVTNGVFVDNARKTAVHSASREVFTMATIELMKISNPSSQRTSAKQHSLTLDNIKTSIVRTSSVQNLTPSQKTRTQVFKKLETEYNATTTEVDVEIQYENNQLTVIARGWDDYVSVRSTVPTLDGMTTEPQDTVYEKPKAPSPSPTPTPAPTPEPTLTPEESPSPTPTPEPTPEETVEETLPESVAQNFTHVSSGNSYACGIANGQAYCWGSNNQGQLGTGSSNSSSVPVPVATDGALQGKELVSISAGNSHTVALDSNGKAYAWGKNTEGQLGKNTGSSSNTPVAVDTHGVLQGKKLVDISAGDSHTVAVDSSGQAYAWGKNNHGQLGNNSRNSSQSPVAVDARGVLRGKTLVAVSAGETHTVALDSNGKAYAWGQNNQQQLGHDGKNRSETPVAVDTSGVLKGKTLIAISTQWGHTVAVDSDGRAYAWGQNNHGQLGTTEKPQKKNPVVAVDTRGVLKNIQLVDVSAGGSHSVALDKDGNVYAWGYNNQGQLGNGTTNKYDSPVRVDTSTLNDTQVVAIGAGDSHTVIVDSQGKAYSWGKGNQGQLGHDTMQGNTASKPSLVDMKNIVK